MNKTLESSIDPETVAIYTLKNSNQIDH